MVEVRNGGGQTIARVGDRVSVRGGESAYVPECGVKGWYAKEPRNADFLVALPRHERERPGLDYARGNLNMQNGCMYIRAQPRGELYSLIWPPGFSMSVEDGSVIVMDESGEVVGREGEYAQFKGRYANLDDDLGRQTRRTLPVMCPPASFWFME